MTSTIDNRLQWLGQAIEDISGKESLGRSLGLPNGNPVTERETVTAIGQKVVSITRDGRGGFKLTSIYDGVTVYDFGKTLTQSIRKGSHNGGYYVYSPTDIGEGKEWALMDSFARGDIVAPFRTATSAMYSVLEVQVKGPVIYYDNNGKNINWYPIPLLINEWIAPDWKKAAVTSLTTLRAFTPFRVVNRLAKLEDWNVF